jgi:hypothetical protein
MMFNYSYRNLSLFILIAVALFSFSSYADTLVLTNGLVLEGKYKGGDETAIKFEVSGKIQEVAISDVESLTFSQAAGQAAAATPTSPAGSITVPAGTSMMVKIDQAISTASHKKGAVITGILDADLVVDKQVAIPKGATLYGIVVESIGGRRIGKQVIGFQFTSIMVGTEKVPITTAPLGAEGGGGGAIRTIAGAALIGGAIDGNSGAKTGALIGAGASVLAGGRHIQIPAGTLAEIPLNEALIIE